MRGDNLGLAPLERSGVEDGFGRRQENLCTHFNSEYPPFVFPHISFHSLKLYFNCWRTEKMKKTFILVVAVLAAAFTSVVSATIINDTAPTWRGQPNTTYQAWGFDTAAATPAVLEAGCDNDYGTPSLTINGVSTGFPPVTYWKNTDNGHQGVWRMYGDSYAQIFLPNVPVINDQKIVQLQITYYASGYTGADPELFVFSSPAYTNLVVNQISKVQLDEHYYYHAIWEIVIEPNPYEETLYILPRDCTIYIDEIIVDTICIPEPATIAVLTLGGLLLRKKNKQ